MDLTVFLHCQLLQNEHVTAAVINKGSFIFDQYFDSQIITRIRDRFVPSIDRQLVLWLVSFVTCLSFSQSVSQLSVYQGIQSSASQFSCQSVGQSVISQSSVSQSVISQLSVGRSVVSQSVGWSIESRSVVRWLVSCQSVSFQLVG